MVRPRRSSEPVVAPEVVMRDAEEDEGVKEDFSEMEGV
jgi:hypothetical protein